MSDIEITPDETVWVGFHDAFADRNVAYLDGAKWVPVAVDAKPIKQAKQDQQPTPIGGVMVNDIALSPPANCGLEHQTMSTVTLTASGQSIRRKMV